MPQYKSFSDSVFTKEEKLALPLRELYDSYGYRPFKMSKFEPYELYLENRSFITGSNILTFTDIGGKLKALKPDVTLSILKNYKGGQQKLRYCENVYREGAGAKEFAEIPQVGLECIGEIDLYTQCEVLELAKKSLHLLSESEDFLLDVASAAPVRALLGETPVTAEMKDRLLRLVREKNLHELQVLCREYPMPEAVFRGWELFTSSYGALSEALVPFLSLSVSEEFSASLEELRSLSKIPGIAEGIRLDFSIVNDLDYYTGLVFKGYLRGIHTPVLSGGRYDRLLWKFGGKGGALGFAVYLDRLREKDIPSGDEAKTELLTYGEGEAPEKIIARAEALRKEGKRVLVCKKEEKTEESER